MAIASIAVLTNATNQVINIPYSISSINITLTDIDPLKDGYLYLQPGAKVSIEVPRLLNLQELRKRGILVTTRRKTYTEPETSPEPEVPSEPSLLTDIFHYWDLDDQDVWEDDGGKLVSPGDWQWDLTKAGSGAAITVVSDAPDGGLSSHLPGSSYLTRVGGSWRGAAFGANGGYPRSACLWYKPTSWSLFGASLMCILDSTDTAFELRALNVPSPAGWFANFSDLDGVADGTLTETVSIDLDEWYFICATTNGVDSHKLYLNGEETTSDDTAFGDPADPTGTFYLGTNGLSVGSSTFSLIGRVAMAGIWERELTPGNVTTLYNSGQGLRFTGLS